MKIRTALLSVSDKEGIVELGSRLAEMGVQILSTGGTAKTLREASVPVTAISEYTGFPEILDGRVKSLHPRIHGGILARHNDEGHRRVLEEQRIAPIGLVVVNLYPFSETIQREGISVEEAVEQIDIGGPTLIRAAAKNHNSVTVVVDPWDYVHVVAEMTSTDGETTAETRRRLCLKAFQHTAAYDAAIATYFETLDGRKEELSMALNFLLRRSKALRYGENPHQRAALYQSSVAAPSGLVAARQHQGKELSFNNYLDLESAWSLCTELDEPACVIIKHTNPCGAATADVPVRAYEKALATDPVSAFGSVIGFNRQVDTATAQKMSTLFVEAVIAPGYDPDALKIFTGKKNLRVMEMSQSALTRPPAETDLDIKKIEGGFLVQDQDRFYLRKRDLQVVTKRSPSEEEIADLLFAWIVAKHVKSNAIIYARSKQTLGVGAGQMSRVDSARLAAEKAQLPLAGCVMASDGFFPFRDGIDAAARVGVKAVIEPGGSIRDEEVIQAADEHGMAMVFTGVRHFRH